MRKKRLRFCRWVSAGTRSGRLAGRWSGRGRGQLAGLLATQRDLTRKEAEHNQRQTASGRRRPGPSTPVASKAPRGPWHWPRLPPCSRREELGRVLAGRLLREYRTPSRRPCAGNGLPGKDCGTDGAPGQTGGRHALSRSAGATEHPFAAGNVPVPDAIEQKITALGELIRRAEDQEAAIKTLETAEALARNQLAAGEIERRQRPRTPRERRAGPGRGADKPGGSPGRVQRTQAGGSGATPAPGHHGDPGNRDSRPAGNPRGRLQVWRTPRCTARPRSKAAGRTSTASANGWTRFSQPSGSALTEKRAHLASMRERAERCAERQALYGDPQSRHRGRAPAHGRDRGREGRATGPDRAHGPAAALAHRSGPGCSAAQEHRPAGTGTAEGNGRISRGAATGGLADEAEFLAARLPVERREDLAARTRALDARRTDLEARHKDRQTRLAVELAKEVTDQIPGRVDRAAAGEEVALQELRDGIAGLKHKARRKRGRQGADPGKAGGHPGADKRVRTLGKSARTDPGSADGKEFRNFAQGLTFELMVGHANRQLRRMTDRYLLQRDRDQPLELNVIDSYQAGEVRSTKNLSGGELPRRPGAGARPLAHGQPQGAGGFALPGRGGSAPWTTRPWTPPWKRWPGCAGRASSSA